MRASYVCLRHHMFAQKAEITPQSAELDTQYWIQLTLSCIIAILANTDFSRKPASLQYSTYMHVQQHSTLRNKYTPLGLNELARSSKLS